MRDSLRKDFPLFRFKLIICGLKIVGKEHIDKMIEQMKFVEENCLDEMGEMIAGFDMVCEEDYNA